uniref:Uncharacterized protein n=1 Tax=Oryza sativa subsp. japonica TaxID=39947 RepID=Q5Z7I3_ORYSJ|nr:hypothetical protein [Oryza sativa Japonica Group]
MAESRRRAWWERDVAVEGVALEAEATVVEAEKVAAAVRAKKAATSAVVVRTNKVSVGEDGCTNTVSATSCPGKFRLSSLPLGQSPPTP